MKADPFEKAALALVELYGKSFGGKASGRFRMPRKLVSDLLGRRRIYAEEIQLLSRALMEQGYVLIDMDSYFVVLSANSFVNYRRANRDCLTNPADI